MFLLPKKLSGLLLNILKSEKKLRYSFRLITGKYPVNLALYKQAVCHSSTAPVNGQGIKNSYERLEYLGDAILGMIVAEFLYKTFPFKEEGFLTKIRSKIVSRESLNHLGQKIGLKELVQYNHSSNLPRSIYGDCLEALIGAVYLDHGFDYTKKFVIKILVKPHYDLEELTSKILNYKSPLLEWAQKESKDLRFEIIGEGERDFTAQVFIDDQAMSKGFGFSKKKAEQDAAQNTYEQLNLD